jgi:phosphoserine phosphatase RsbU/P
VASGTGLPGTEDLYDYAACGLLVTDVDGTIRVVNDTFCQWTGHRRDALIGQRRLQDLLTMGGRIFHQTHWAPLLQMQGSVAEVKLDVIHASGEVKPMILNAVSRTTGNVVRHEIAAFSAADRHRYEHELLLARRRAEELHTRSMATQRELVAAQAELDLQKKAAEDRALFAEQMVGIVSHDLRNPLSVIQLSAALLQRAPLTKEALGRVEAILRATGRGARLIADLLDFTQARMGGGLRINPRRIDPHVVLAQAIEDLRLSHPGRELFHSITGTGECTADADRLTQLIGNLVSNAMTHGDPASPVTVSSAIDERELTIEVHNRGPVIAPEDLPRIFDAMTRGDASGVAQGVGLGLFIVREIAREHGGGASARSSKLDGTVVSVTLPVGGRTVQPG